MIEEKAKEPNQDELTMAHKTLETEKQARAQACFDDIQTALRKHRCRLSYAIKITSEGRVIPEFSIAAIDAIGFGG